MGSWISKTIVAGVAAPLLAASAAVATAEQWSVPGFSQGGGLSNSRESRPSWGDDLNHRGRKERT
jgi:hypothetical protein